MKLNFDYADDGICHQYCIDCHQEAVDRIYHNGNTYYDCGACHQENERSIVIDPAITWWEDAEGEYWHASSGVFVRDPTNRFLFFERTIFPFASTVPSGHIDAGESVESSAVRELHEEVGIEVDPSQLTLLGVEKLIGDSCRRGSDAHEWHAYLLPLKQDLEVHVKEEGGRPVWLSLDDALQKKLTYPARYVINKYRDELSAGTT